MLPHAPSGLANVFLRRNLRPDACEELRGDALVWMENFESSPADKKWPAYAFGRFRLEADGALMRGETPVELPADELAALRLLLERQGKMVTQAELRQAMGADAPLTPEGIAETVASLRRRLEPDDPIESVYKRGFRFTAEIHAPAAAWPAALPHIAILPLTGECGVPDYLGSVVAKGAIGRLSRRRPAACTLAARESVETLAQRGLSAIEIGRAMQAEMVVTGSLRALLAHDRMRLEAIRVDDGAILWSEDVLVERSRIAGLCYIGNSIAVVDPDKCGSNDPQRKKPLKDAGPFSAFRSRKTFRQVQRDDNSNEASADAL